ncbi:hypothetical protein N0V91_007949 [Didymella pomorum]|uniref:Major facilitator superfamily (MFS) profile domain-containing protein n=1 Tax=Didymella pomorum TaxID=749634 RepID=A0A9W8ZBU9_9PLEO|nr:hypothetical protein N0V91_007949 [Didymella pomorum]
MSKSTIPLVYLTSFLFLFGETLQPASRIAIYESIVCQQHYGTPDPHDCKIAPVQEELAFLGGIERLSIIIPSILAIPFAALADRYGHSLILAIAIFGVFLEDGWPFVVCWFPDVFPIRLIWLHFLFSCVGGGFTVVVTLLHVIIADVVSAEERTRIFFRARAAGVGASILGYAAGGVLMKTNEFLPWAIGLVTLILGTTTAALIPRTTVQERKNLEDDDVTRNWSVQSSLRATENISSLLASFLTSFEMGVEFFALAFMLPALTSRLPASFQSRTTFAKDQAFAVCSLALLAIGLLCLGLAPVIGIAIAGIVILALGSGQDSLTRSMATEMVRTEEISTTYSAITMLRAIGGSISGPMCAWLYGIGLRHKGEAWIGLPYLVAGILFVLATIMAGSVRNPKRDDDATTDEAREPLLA